MHLEDVGGAQRRRVEAAKLRVPLLLRHAHLAHNGRQGAREEAGYVGGRTNSELLK